MLNLVHDRPVDRFADILTSAKTGHDIGRRLGGLRAGPTLLVATGPGLYNALVNRLAALPSLPWMRGSLLLVRLSNVQDGLDDLWIDDIVSLPQQARDPDTVAGAYWTVMRKATAMGMIDGRGVPTSLRVADVA